MKLVFTAHQHHSTFHAAHDSKWVIVDGSPTPELDVENHKTSELITFSNLHQRHSLDFITELMHLEQNK